MVIEGGWRADDAIASSLVRQTCFQLHWPYASEVPINLPVSYDLTAFVEELCRHSKTKPVGQALCDLLDVASAHADLLFARELLHAIVLDARNELDQSIPFNMSVRGAALSQAILLYSRATIVKSARKTFDIRGRLTPDQKLIHTRIGEFRNAAIAHFDRTSRHQGALWSDERLILAPTIPLENGPVRPALRRLAVRQELVEEMLSQTDAALVIYGDMIRQKFVSATSKLDVLLREQPNLFEEIKESPFDPLSFFSSLEKAVDFLGPGEMSATLHEVLGNSEDLSVTNQ